MPVCAGAIDLRQGCIVIPLSHRLRSLHKLRRPLSLHHSRTRLPVFAALDDCLDSLELVGRTGADLTDKRRNGTPVTFAHLEATVNSCEVVGVAKPPDGLI